MFLMVTDASFFFYEPAKWAEAIEAVRVRHRMRLEEIKALKATYGEMYSWKEQCEEFVKRMWKKVNGKRSRCCCETHKTMNMKYIYICLECFLKNLTSYPELLSTKKSGYKIMKNNCCDCSLHNRFPEVFQLYLFLSARKQLVLTK